MRAFSWTTGSRTKGSPSQVFQKGRDSTVDEQIVLAKLVCDPQNTMHFAALGSRGGPELCVPVRRIDRGNRRTADSLDARAIPERLLYADAADRHHIPANDASHGAGVFVLAAFRRACLRRARLDRGPHRLPLPLDGACAGTRVAACRRRRGRPRVDRFQQLVHAGDGWTAVVPWGLILSVATFIAMVISNWLGRALMFHHGVGVRRHD